MSDNINADVPVPDAANQWIAPRHTRRLSDKVLIAFHQACDQQDYEVAEDLLRILETMLTRRPTSLDGNRRRNVESLVAAHVRLWMLKHPEVDQA